MNDADKCRMEGWEVGTWLIGNEGYGDTVIKITAIGEEKILARQISHDGVISYGNENMWTLNCRDWRKVT